MDKINNPQAEATPQKKGWETPELILIDSEEIKHAANTISDGTGNLFS